VELSSGIRDPEPDDDNGEESVQAANDKNVGSTTQGFAKLKNPTNPSEKLKQALSSKKSFQDYYLELSELAISTYKHIGRIRSARFIGMDLAKFYQKLGQVRRSSS